MRNIIELKIEQKPFKKQSILNDFRLTVVKGEQVAIIGESGVGKTSLLNILGFLDYHYDGEYILFGNDTQKYNEIQKAQIRNEKIGFILQESSLIDTLTIGSNIKLPLLYSKENRNQQHYFEKLTEKLNIQSILEKKPLECSGGQRSRAAIARALIMKPEIILADEPTSSLDEKNKQNVLDIMKQLKEDLNTTLITVTHDQTVSEQHDRIIQLR